MENFGGNLFPLWLSIQISVFFSISASALKWRPRLLPEQTSAEWTQIIFWKFTFFLIENDIKLKETSSQGNGSIRMCINYFVLNKMKRCK